MNKIIFTDCFNTIILRKESDKVVLFNWCKKLGEKYHTEPAIIYHFFSKYRIRQAIKTFLKTGEPEIKFFNVITALAEVLDKNITKLDINTFKKDALDLYILAESESHYLNEDFVKRLKQFKKEGAKIYILSEFYCEKKVLLKWFKNLGVAELFDDIFVSCDYTATKRSTRLYKIAIKSLKINKKDITMFGDNKYADIFAARRIGIKAERIITKIEKTPKKFKQIKIYGENYEKLNEICNKYGDNYNYSNHAFPLFLFIRRLYASLRNNDVKNVFFLSREGLFLKKLFDKYVEVSGLRGIKSHYLEVSRNALYRVNFQPLESQSFELLLNKTYKTSVYQFLNSLSFSEQEILKIKAELGENINKKKRRFEKTKTFKKLKKSITFQTVYEIKRKEQEGFFDKYLQLFEVDFQKEGLTVVDVGWRGSMQDLLEKYLKDIKVSGYYVGCFKVAFTKNVLENISKKIGLLHHINKNQFGNKCFKPIFLDYEQICRADRGCVYGYKAEGNVIKVIYENKVDEKKLHKTYILPLQNQIIDKFEQLCKLEYENLSILEPLAVIMHMDIYKNLSRQDIDFYVNGINSHFDNFGCVGIPAGNSLIKRIGFRVASYLLRLRFLRFPKKRVFRQFYKQIEKKKS